MNAAQPIARVAALRGLPVARGSPRRAEVVLVLVAGSVAGAIAGASATSSPFMVGLASAALGAAGGRGAVRRHPPPAAGPRRHRHPAAVRRQPGLSRRRRRPQRPSGWTLSITTVAIVGSTCAWRRGCSSAAMRATGARGLGAARSRSCSSRSWCCRSVLRRTARSPASRSTCSRSSRSCSSTSRARCGAAATSLSSSSRCSWGCAWRASSRCSCSRRAPTCAQAITPWHRHRGGRPHVRARSGRLAGTSGAQRAAATSRSWCRWRSRSS